MSSPALRVGGVVLCGGKSSRMGAPKAWLQWGDETLLQRTVRVVSSVVQPVVVVAAEGQNLPALPAAVEIIRDERPHLGPLAGMLGGLSRLAELEIDAAYVSGCDAPLLSADAIRFVIGRLESHEIAVPLEGPFYHPLAGVYRMSLAPRIRELIESGERRPRTLIETSDTACITEAEYRTVDPGVSSLRNANTSEELEAIRREVRLN
jgi:molybdopterin-guanine dinucleotide biosynthesis protein A